MSRQHFRKISVIHGDLTKLQQFEGPEGVRFRERPRPEQLARFSFVDYVGEMFSGPPAVRAHLYMHTAVYNTAVFSQENDHTPDISRQFPKLRKYYVGKVLNVVRISKYSKEVTRAEEDISYFKPHRLNVNFDQEEISRLERMMKDIEVKESEASKSIRKINEQEAKNKKQLQQIEHDIAEVTQAKLQKKELELSLRNKKELVEKLSRPSNDEVHSKKIDEYKSSMKQITLDLVKSLEEAQKMTRLASTQYTRNSLLQLRQHHLHAKYSFNTTELNRVQSEINDLNVSLRAETQRLEDWKERLRKSKDEAHGCTSDEARAADKVNKKPPPKYAEAFQTIEANTVEDLKALIEGLDKEVRAEDRLTAERVKITKQYAERRESIKSIEAELMQLKQEVAGAEEESEKISTVGVQKLQELVEKVNDKFSAYFAELGFLGQVTLCRREVEDYKSYGVSIKVKFRDESELAELSRGRQSGGEMSVTTAVYMLALQELTTVPFRCVDEINQGLDERNERKVWDMILTAATAGQGSQYFYLAPKMPYNLLYKPGTVVHFCSASDTIQRSDHLSEGRSWVQRARSYKSTKL